MDSGSFCGVVIGLVPICWGIYLIATGLRMPKESDAGKPHRVDT